MRHPCSWPPRTEPTPGKGYLFFQGPTPKTAVQKDLPDFFSSDNFADVQVEPIQFALAGTGLGALALIVLGLNSAPVSMPAAPAAKPLAMRMQAAGFEELCTREENVAKWDAVVSCFFVE